MQIGDITMQENELVVLMGFITSAVLSVKKKWWYGLLSLVGCLVKWLWVYW